MEQKIETNLPNGPAAAVASKRRTIAPSFRAEIDLNTASGIAALRKNGTGQMRQALATRDDAFRLLVKEGIITKHGTLSKNYRST